MLKTTKSDLAKKLPEIKDIPNVLKLVIYGSGSLIGEEDILYWENYSCSLKCISQKGCLYAINKQNFVTLKSQDETWLQINEKVI